jgi:hypothetical protein
MMPGSCIAAEERFCRQHALNHLIPVVAAIVLIYQLDAGRLTA